MKWDCFYDYHNWRIKHNLFLDPREFVSLLEVKGQSYLHHLIHYSGKWWCWRRLRCMPEGVEEAKSSTGEDADTSSGAWGVDQSVGYIVHFANAVELYQRNWNCFRCSGPDHLVKDCLKDLSKNTQKVTLNTEGMMKKRGWAPQKPVVAQLASPDGALWAWGCLKKLPSWNQIHWLIGVDLRT